MVSSIWLGRISGSRGRNYSLAVFLLGSSSMRKEKKEMKCGLTVGSISTLLINWCHHHSSMRIKYQYQSNAGYAFVSLHQSSCTVTALTPFRYVASASLSESRAFLRLRELLMLRKCHVSVQDFSLQACLTCATNVPSQLDQNSLHGIISFPARKAR